jgi:hypothetical protein
MISTVERIASTNKRSLRVLEMLIVHGTSDTDSENSVHRQMMQLPVRISMIDRRFGAGFEKTSSSVIATSFHQKCGMRIPFGTFRRLNVSAFVIFHLGWSSCRET